MSRTINVLGVATLPMTGATFQYDAFGRRTQKTVGGVTTRVLSDGLNVTRELGDNPATLLTGLGLDEVFLRTDANGARFLLPDGLGSTLALTDANGTIQTSYTYDPFGTAATTGTPNANSFQYTGRENDATGLYYYRARYYHPTFQRFTSEDPIGFEGGINMYAYVEGNPMLFTDPQGLDVFVTFWPADAGGAGHVGVGVNTDHTVGFYPNQKRPSCALTGCPGDPNMHPGVGPQVVRIPTTPNQDRDMQRRIDEWRRHPGNYNVFNRNCADFVEDVLRAGGQNPPTTRFPRELFQSLRNRRTRRRLARRQ